MEQYLKQELLKGKQIRPKLLWKLPERQDGIAWRWAYVRHAEESLLDLIKDQLRIVPQPATGGFAPVFDARVSVPDEECDIDIEIKFTQGHNLFVECAYGNGKHSGVLTSKSDFYLVVSRDVVDKGQPTEYMKGKLRLYPKWRLLEFGDHWIDKYGVKSFEPSPDSPGSQGFYVNSFAFDEFHATDAHIWVGDINCYVDESDNITYDLSSFRNESRGSLRPFMREVRKILNQKEQDA